MIPGLLLALLVPLGGSAETIPQVDGKRWQASSLAEQRSYIVGVGNLLDIEYAYQRKSGDMPSDQQSVIRRLYEQTDGVTLDGVIQRVSDWYAAHPQERGRAVLEVIWMEMVER